MASLNQVQIVGFCGRDPDSRFMPNGDPVASVSVAVTEKYKETESTTWFDCSFFGRQAEVASKYLTKGSLVFIQGPIALNTYQKKDGTHGASLKVIVREFKMLTPRRDEDSDKEDSAKSGRQATPSKANKIAKTDSLDDLDIPF